MSAQERDRRSGDRTRSDAGGTNGDRWSACRWRLAPEARAQRGAAAWTRRSPRRVVAWALTRALSAVMAGAAAPKDGMGSKALYTTTPDGAAVNENHYASRLEAYLNGGPVPTGQEDGDWMFQVTDPSGAVRLSSDPAACRCSGPREAPSWRSGT